MHAVVLYVRYPNLRSHGFYDRQPCNGFYNQVAHGLKREKLCDIPVVVVIRKHLKVQNGACNALENIPNKQKPERKSRPFHKNSKEQAKREKSYKLNKVGEQILQVAEHDAHFVIGRKAKPEHE